MMVVLAGLTCAWKEYSSRTPVFIAAIGLDAVSVAEVNPSPVGIGVGGMIPLMPAQLEMDRTLAPNKQYVPLPSVDVLLRPPQGINTVDWYNCPAVIHSLATKQFQCATYGNPEIIKDGEEDRHNANQSTLAYAPMYFISN